MLPEPLVSVIIPAYNAEGTIEYAIQSVLEQTVPELEVITIDDASTDGTTCVVEGIRDSRVRLLRSARNSGPAAARNSGLKHAKGTWVAFLDADDEWVPDRLERLLDAAAGSECFVGDWMVGCIPGPGGRLAPWQVPELPANHVVESLDFAGLLSWGRSTQPIVSKAAIDRHSMTFPEWGSGGDWQFFIASLSANGLPGRLLHYTGYLRRLTGEHNSSSLRAIEEQLRVQELLATNGSLPWSVRDTLRRGTPGIRRRLLAASLRERRWGKLAAYARHNPGDLLGLPRSVIAFLSRKARYQIATRFGS